MEPGSISSVTRYKLSGSPWVVPLPTSPPHDEVMVLCFGDSQKIWRQPLSFSSCESIKFRGEWVPCRRDRATGAYEDDLTFYCSFHTGLSLNLNFSSRTPSGHCDSGREQEGKWERTSKKFICRSSQPFTHLSIHTYKPFSQTCLLRGCL